MLEDFETWLAAARPAEDRDLAGDAHLLLDWRWGYSTGELDDFGDGDIAEFLLEWCPRKLSAPPDAAAGLCRSAGVFIEFMAATGRLVGGPDRAGRLIAIAEELEPDTYEAMGDPSKFEMAKSLFGGPLGGDGEEPDEPTIDDPQAMLDERREAFNACHSTNASCGPTVS